MIDVDKSWNSGFVQAVVSILWNKYSSYRYYPKVIQKKIHELIIDSD